MSIGYISIHRQIMSHWVAKSDRDFARWVKILLEVNHADAKFPCGNHLYVIRRGQSCNSYRTWADILGCGKNAVKPFFDMLATDGLLSIEVLGSGKFSTTLLTVLNYNKYQSQTSISKKSTNTSAVDKKGTQVGKQSDTVTARDSDTNNNNQKEYKKEVTDFLQIFNEELQSTYRYNRGLHQNYSYWRESYTAEEIQNAIKNYTEDFWAKNLSPLLMLKKENKQGQPMDIIGELLSHNSGKSNLQNQGII